MRGVPSEELALQRTVAAQQAELSSLRQQVRELQASRRPASTSEEAAAGCGRVRDPAPSGAARALHALSDGFEWANLSAPSANPHLRVATGHYDAIQSFAKHLSSRARRQQGRSLRLLDIGGNSGKGFELRMRKLLQYTSLDCTPRSLERSQRSLRTHPLMCEPYDSRFPIPDACVRACVRAARGRRRRAAEPQAAGALDGGQRAALQRAHRAGIVRGGERVLGLRAPRGAVARRRRDGAVRRPGLRRAPTLLAKLSPTAVPPTATGRPWQQRPPSPDPSPDHELRRGAASEAW